MIWPEGDESRKVRIQMPDQGVATTDGLTVGEAKPDAHGRCLLASPVRPTLLFYTSQK